MKCKETFLFLAVLLCSSAVAHAQQWSGIIDPSRAIDWSQAGVVGGIPSRTSICATLNPGATAAQINSAIANCPSGQVVYLNAGTYNLAGGIVFNNQSNVTLRGAGPDQTLLVFSAGGDCAGWGGADVCFYPGDTGDAGDGNYSNAATWTAGYSQGTTSITLGSITKGSISNLAAGSVIFLDQLEDASDPGTVYVCANSGNCSTSGANNGRSSPTRFRPVYGIHIVQSVSGTGPWTVVISPGVRMPNIQSGLNPQAWWDTGPPIQGDGIEALSMDHTISNNSGNGTSSGSFILNGYNIWFKNIRDIGSNQHIWLYQTTHVTVRDSYFTGSAGSTSQNYGMDPFISADDLFENNIFQHMPFPIMNEGCIGCVAAYNFACDDLYTGTPVGSATDWQQASSYHHGDGDAFILWEGNQGIGLTSDDIHGTSNFFTAFRNYWNGRDPGGGSSGGKATETQAVILESFNRYYNLIGNVLGTSGYHTQYQSIAPSGATNCSAYIYNLAWSGNNCNTGSIANDPTTSTTLMRWGNYDVVNAAVRWVSSEVPSGLSSYANPVPGNDTLPASFYLTAMPTWWGVVGQAAIPWPAVGPDVTGGNVSNVGGHAYNIPAASCYLNIMGGKTDGTSGVLTFNANSCYPMSPNRAPVSPTNLQVK